MSNEERDALERDRDYLARYPHATPYDLDDPTDRAPRPPIVAVDGTKHSADCWYPARLAEEQAYAARWPKSCQMCGGAGEVDYSYDPSPAGVSLGPGSITDREPCAGELFDERRCVEQGYCPRCARPGLVSDGRYDYALCIGCAWYAGHSKPAPPPIEDPCACLYPSTWHWDQESAPY